MEVSSVLAVVSEGHLYSFVTDHGYVDASPGLVSPGISGSSLPVDTRVVGH